MNKEIFVVLAYDYEGYMITGICETKEQITEEMLDNGLLKTKVVKADLNTVIKRDLLDYEEIVVK